MTFDPATLRTATSHLKKSDRVLRNVIDSVGPFTLKPAGGGYEIVVRSILSQQISTAAARTIRQRLEGLLPGGKIRPQNVAALSDDQLQSAGVSFQKRTYIRDLTDRTLDGRLNFRRIAGRPDEEAIAELVEVKGIGRWTAQMYLIFSLGRPNLFPVDDLGIRNAMTALYDLPEKTLKSDLEEIAEAWSPWKTIASWYLWRSLDL